MPTPSESLASFYNSITDRRQVEEQIKWEQQNNPAMAGLSFEQTGKVINDVIGAAPGSRFDMFSSKTRVLDALGYYAKETFSGAPTTPSNYIDQMQGKVTRTWSNVGGDVGAATGRLFGAEGQDLQMWEETGKGMPAGLGSLALGAIPVVGPYAMAATTYGTASNDAKQAGATEGQAMAVGALNTAVNMLCLKASAPMSNKFAAVGLEKTLGAGAQKALLESSGLVLKEGKELGGKAAIELAKQQGKVTAGKALGLKLGADTATEVVFGATAVANQIASEAILDPEGAKEHMLNPQYWASTIVSQGVMSVLGVTMGNMTKGEHLNDVALLDDKKMPIFKKSETPEQDMTVPAEATATAAMEADAEVRKTLVGKVGEEATNPIVDDSATAITTVANALTATHTVGANTNTAQAAAEVLAKGDSDLVEGLLRDSVVINNTEPPKFSVPVSNFQVQHRKIQITLEDGAKVDFDAKLVGKPIEEILAAAPDENSRAVFQDIAVQLNKEHAKYMQDADVAFDANFTPEAKLSYTGFLESSGMLDAAKALNSKIRFINNKKTDSWLERFAVAPGASFASWTHEDSTVIFINAPHENRLSDPHELGHVFDELVSRGGYGDKVTQQWQALKTKFAPAQTVEEVTKLNKSPSNILSATVGSELENKLNGTGMTVGDMQKYYATQREWAAQALHGYLLNKPTKFKSFVETNFPELHALFTKVVDALKNTFKTKKTVTKADTINAWQTGQAEANAFFESVFTSINKPNTENEVRALIKEHKLTPKAAASLIEATTGGRTLAGKAAAFEAVKLWSKGEHKVESDLLDNLEFVKQLNTSGLSFADLLAPKTHGLPNVRRMMNLDPAAVRAEFSVRVANEPEGSTVLADAYKDYMGEVDQIATRGRRALTAIDNVLSQKVAYLEKEFGEASYYDKGILLMQVDATLGKWFRGELPGQQGRFMWEKRGKEDFAAEQAKIDPSLRNKPDLRREQQEILFKKEFPILSAEIKKLRTGERNEEWVKENPNSDEPKWTPRMTFTSKDEAAAYAETKNNAGDNMGYSYTPKRIVKKKSEEVWGVRARRDDRKSIVAEYRDDLASAIDAAEAFHDDPKTSAWYYQTREAQLQQSYYGKLSDHVERITKENFQQWRTGNRNVFPEQMQKALVSYYKFAGQEGKTWVEQLSKDLGIGFPHKIEDVLISLVKMASEKQQDKNDYIRLSPKPLYTLFENYKNYMKEWIRADMKLNVERALQNKTPYLLNDKSSWKAFEAGFSNLEDKNFMQQMDVLQHATPGGIARKAAAGIEYAGLSPRSLVGKTMSMIEKLHTGTYGGMQNIAETNKYFKELGIYVDAETPIMEFLGNRIIRNLRGKGEVVTDANGEKRFMLHPDTEKMDDKAYVAVHGSKKLKPIVNRIQLMQNEAGGIKFSQVLANDLTVGKGSGKNATPDEIKMRAELAKEANDLIAKNFDTNNPKHREELDHMDQHLERSYTAHRELAQVVFEREMDLQLLTTANAILRGVDYTGTPEQARELATKLQVVDRTDPKTHEVEFFKLLMDPVDKGGAGWDSMQAVSFHEKWLGAVDEIHAMRDWMLSTPGYIKEQRMKRWHVSYTEAKPTGGEAGTGLRDFDTQEEALKFMREAPGMGLKLNVKTPTDTRERAAKYRTGTDMLDEVVNKVVKSRQNILGIVLEPKLKAGLIDQAEYDNYLKVLSGMSEDIAADMTTSRLKDVIAGHRLFKPGREHLDMARQQEEGAWRMAIQYARKHTDLGFQLFMEDPRLAPYQYERERFITGKEAMRTPDGKGQRTASKAAFTYFLLGNMSSAMIEAAQWPLGLSHILVEEGSGILDAFRVPAKMMAKAGKASIERLRTGSDASVWDPDTLALIRYAEESNRLGVRPLNDISTDNVEAKLEYARKISDPGGTGLGARGGKVAHSIYSGLNRFYAGFSRINAELSLASAYDILKRKEYPNRKPNAQEQMELFEKAIRVSNKANGSWGRGNRPWWFDTKSTSGRTVAQLAWSLQGFASNHVANHLRLIKKSIGHSELGLSKEEISQSRKALAVMTTMQVAALGVMGHTLAGGMSKLIANTFGYDAESELLDGINEFLDENTDWEPEDRHALSDMVVYGGLHALGTPVDIASRVSVSGLGPLNSYEGWNASSFGGPMLSTLGNLIDGWNTVSKGDGSAESYMRWGTRLLPTGIQRAIRMEFFDDGKVYNKAGQFVMDPTTTEKIAAYAGFAPTRYSDAMRVKSKMIQANMMDGVERTRAAQTIHTALVEGRRFDALDMLNTLAPQVGMSPKDLAGRVAEMSITSQFGQQSNEGSGPNAQRAARLYQSALPQVTGVEKDRVKYKTLAMLNQLPLDWRRRMHRTALVDEAMSLGGFSHTTAVNSLRNPMVKSTVMSSLREKSLQRPVGLAGFSDLLSQ